jgi:hypothetical protein
MRLFVLFCVPLLAAEPVVQSNIRIPMRDGVRLSANVFRPSQTGEFPVVLQRTPYGKVASITPGIRAFLDAGYAVVSQDVRGRNGSEGRFGPITQETPDGERTIAWIAAQPWCDGNIGMFGGSYVGIVQWRAALSGHPTLKVIAPSVAGSDDYFDRFYSPGGAFKLGHRLRWISENFKAPGAPTADFYTLVRHLPLLTSDLAAVGAPVPLLRDVLAHPSYDPFWESQSIHRNAARLKIPALIVTGWYDNFVEGDIAMFSALRENGVPARLVVGPFGHDLSPRMPDATWGAEASVPIRQAEIEWFDRFLKPSKQPPVSGVRYFVTGANEWRESAAWPPGGSNPVEVRLTTRKDEPKSAYTYDPSSPVPTLGGAVCCNAGVFPWGPRDQRLAEVRKDVLVFTSEPLEKPLEIAGSVMAVLWVSTSAPDTDFTVKLTDVSPDGASRILSDGILRLRYRHGVQRVAPYKPGAVERIRISAGVAAHRFLPGHRIRISVSSSNFPRFDRNLNTGRPNASETATVRARQTLYHDSAHPSHVLLPVVLGQFSARLLR